MEWIPLEQLYFSSVIGTISSSKKVTRVSVFVDDGIVIFLSIP